MRALSTKDSGYIASEAQRVLTVLKTNDQKIAYAKALQRSAELDINGNIPPAPSSVSDIESLYGFSARIQKEYALALNKQEAKKFLIDFGFPVNKSFDKIYNRQTCEQFFKREIAIVFKRQILLTYSEWLHLVQFEFQPELPKIITDILK